jgi:hypothetical protein
MARRNIEEYHRVLTILDTEPYKNKDGNTTLNSIETVFVAVTDKVRPDTIRVHIDRMCALNLLSKKGEVTFTINPDWRKIVNSFNM